MIATNCDIVRQYEHLDWLAFFVAVVIDGIDEDLL